MGCNEGTKITELGKGDLFHRLLKETTPSSFTAHENQLKHELKHKSSNYTLLRRKHREKTPHGRSEKIAQRNEAAFFNLEVPRSIKEGYFLEFLGHYQVWPWSFSLQGSSQQGWKWCSNNSTKQSTVKPWYGHNVTRSNPWTPDTMLQRFPKF